MRKAKEYARMKGVQNRKHLFYAHPIYFPNWDTARYPSRTAFGMNLADYYYKDKKEYKYTYRGRLYSISRSKALKVAVPTKANPALPDSVPLEAWTDEGEIPSTKRQIEWEYDPVKDVMFEKGSRDPVVPKQESLF